jgi:hypothetical protein
LDISGNIKGRLGRKDNWKEEKEKAKELAHDRDGYFSAKVRFVTGRCYLIFEFLENKVTPPGYESWQMKITVTSPGYHASWQPGWFNFLSGRETGRASGSALGDVTVIFAFRENNSDISQRRPRQ